MTSESVDWDEDLPAEPEEEYQSFVRTLKRTEGFRLLFIRCSPAESKRLIAKVKKDIINKEIDVLELDKPIENLYSIVEALLNKKKLDIIFINGIENSLIEYIKPGSGGQGEFYKVDSVPRILNHLNQQRERFRDNFNICFIFIVRLFGLKYFIHRAPDFYDWRSGEFQFGQEKVTFTVDIQPKLYQQLKNRAKADSEEMSATARQALALYLAHLEVEDE